MRTFFLLLAFILNPAFAADAWQPSASHVQIPLWPGDAPNLQPARGPEYSVKIADKLVAGKPYTMVGRVSVPTMTVYAPKKNNTGAAVIVFPGGGYQALPIDLEGTEACDWLTAKGLTCVLLKYRVPNTGLHWDENCKCQVPPKALAALEDAQRTISLVRLHAKEWHIDPHKVGVLGFSAGGHLVAEVSTQFKTRAYKPVDAADKLSSRPDFAVVLYPGNLWIDESKFELNPGVPVSFDAPPTMIIQATDDPLVDVNNALVYYIALKKAHVPVEMHLFEKGGHAFGLRPTATPITHWPKLVEAWLASRGIIH